MPGNARPRAWFRPPRAGSTAAQLKHASPASERPRDQKDTRAKTKSLSRHDLSSSFGCLRQTHPPILANANLARQLGSPAPAQGGRSPLMTTLRSGEKQTPAYNDHRNFRHRFCRRQRLVNHIPINLSFGWPMRPWESVSAAYGTRRGGASSAGCNLENVTGRNQDAHSCTYSLVPGVRTVHDCQLEAAIWGTRLHNCLPCAMQCCGCQSRTGRAL